MKRVIRLTAIVIVVVLLAAALVIHPAPASAQDVEASTDLAPANADAPALEIGAEIVVSALDNEQYIPAAAYNSKHNEYLVVWHNKWGGGYRDIYAQRVTASGQLKSWFAVSADPSGSKSRAQPAVAYDPEHDRYLVVWAYDVNGNGTNWDIYGRFIPWDGPDNAMGEFVICDWNSSQMNPDIAYAVTQKEFLVVWSNLSSPGVPGYVSGRRIFAGGGSPDTKGFTIASNGTDVRQRPDVTYNLARNEYLVVFDDNIDIFGARLSGNGSLLAGGEFPIAGWPSTEQFPAVAACDGADQYLVVWHSLITHHHDIYGRILTGDGAPTTMVLHIQGKDTELDEQKPETVCDATRRNYLVVWEQQVGLGGVTQGWGLRRVHTNGVMEGVWGFIGAADLSSPVLTAGKVNSLAVWEQKRANSSFQDIHASLIHMERMFLPSIIK